jgi:CRISPR/Cas system-associated exonuclease Cas4 (RecB family)
MKAAHIRPSALPKLEKQPCFVGASGEASEAAQRGTAMDYAWRRAILGDFQPCFALPEADRDAVEWAIIEARNICGNSHVETDEEKTRFTHPYFLNPFTADGICFEKNIVLDLKTGQIRSYRAQLAAYCLALMTETWTQRAVGVAIFCDQREALHYDFTWQEANDYVTAILDEVSNRAPNDYMPGEYCGWCAYADTCPARVRDAEAALVAVEGPQSLSEMREAILSSPERIGEFWRRYKLFEKEIAEPIGKAMREKLDAQETIPGWRIQYDKPREFFDAEGIKAIADELTTGELITLLGAKVSVKAMREFCDVKGLALPSEFVRSGAPIAKLMPEKKTKQKN